MMNFDFMRSSRPLAKIAKACARANVCTSIAFKSGREVARQSGALDLPGLLGWIKANV